MVFPGIGMAQSAAKYALIAAAIAIGLAIIISIIRKIRRSCMRCCPCCGKLSAEDLDFGEAENCTMCNKKLTQTEGNYVISNADNPDAPPEQVCANCCFNPPKPQEEALEIEE